MKTREQKQKDLEALTQQFQEATAAMLMGFNKLTVTKDQELRRQLDQVGAKYMVVKNTLARRAVEGTPFAGLATRSISSFRNREDLIDVALASAHVPLFLDGRVAARCRGRWCIDGSFCYILFRWVL